MFASPQLPDVPTVGGLSACRDETTASSSASSTAIANRFVESPPAGRVTEAIYYASRLTSQAGQGIFFAFLVIVAGPTEGGGALGLGSVMIAMTIAAIVLGPFGGAAVDRLGPRFALPTGALLRLAAIVAGLLIMGHGEHAWMAAFVYSAASQVFSPAELALVLAIRRQRPAGAHASLFALQFGGQAVGAFALAPLLYWAGGLPAMLTGAFVVYGGVVVLALVLGRRLLPVTARWPRPRRTGRAFGSTLGFGATLRFIGGRPQALYAVGLLAFVDVMSKCLLIAAPIYFQSELELSGAQVVALAGTVAAGALAGLGWSARFLPPARAPFAMRVILLGALVATFALTPLGDGLGTLTVTGAALDFGGIAGPLGAGSLAAIPAVFALGVALSAAPIVARSVLTATAPAELQGRVFAAEAVLSNVLVVPALLLAALSTDLMSARATVMLLGLIGGLVFLLLELRALRVERVTRLDAVPVPERA